MPPPATPTTTRCDSPCAGRIFVPNRLICWQTLKDAVRCHFLQSSPTFRHVIDTHLRIKRTYITAQCDVRAISCMPSFNFLFPAQRWLAEFEAAAPPNPSIACMHEMQVGTCFSAPP